MPLSIENGKEIVGKFESIADTVDGIEVTQFRRFSRPPSGNALTSAYVEFETFEALEQLQESMPYSMKQIFEISLEGDLANFSLGRTIQEEAVNFRKPLDARKLQRNAEIFTELVQYLASTQKDLSTDVITQVDKNTVAIKESVLPESMIEDQGSPLVESLSQCQLKIKQIKQYSSESEYDYKLTLHSRVPHTGLDPFNHDIVTGLLHAIQPDFDCPECGETDVVFTAKQINRNHCLNCGSLSTVSADTISSQMQIEGILKFAENLNPNPKLELEEKFTGYDEVHTKFREVLETQEVDEFEEVVEIDVDNKRTILCYFSDGLTIYSLNRYHCAAGDLLNKNNTEEFSKSKTCRICIICGERRTCAKMFNFGVCTYDPLSNSLQPTNKHFCISCFQDIACGIEELVVNKIPNPKLLSLSI